MSERETLQNQAQIFGRYLVGTQPDKRAVDLYVKAMTGTNAKGADATLLQYLQKHPRSVGLIDGGLALVSPQSEVRRRLYIMFAILEASPAYVDKFLPQDRSKLYALHIIGVGIRAAFRGVIGMIIVKIVGRA
jgi:hypothetical protein